MRQFALVSIVLFACSGEPSVPKGVLGPKKMEAVLYDVIRADEMVDFYSLQDSTYRNFSKRTALYDTIFQLHAIDKATFQNSMNYYQSRPDLLKIILEQLQKKTDSSQVQKPVQ